MADERRPVALVTGGRQGLGRGAALALADAGFDLVIVDQVEDERSTATLADLQAKGASAVFCRGDIAEIASHAALIEQAWSAFGGIECLVNNAGIAVRPLTDVLEVQPEAFDRNLAVNLRGTFFLTQAVAKRMLTAPAPCHHRSIVVISSIAAGFASVDRPQYSISKAGLSIMAEIFAVRLAEAGIAVYEIRPGLIRTDMTRSGDVTATDRSVTSGRVPARRWGEPDDVGTTVATLAAGRLPYVTGQTIFVDGGIHISRV
jgi:NAD(P)-dependent dehydrogenase (short-subunit alcohol dehydrogenase family)